MILNEKMPYKIKKKNLKKKKQNDEDNNNHHNDFILKTPPARPIRCLKHLKTKAAHKVQSTEQSRAA